MSKTKELKERIANRIIVDCGYDSEYPCPHIQPYMGYPKCPHEDKDICMWQERQAEEMLQICKESGLMFTEMKWNFGKRIQVSESIEVE